ncbi:MAG: ATP-dependent helicase [Deltaproteobacteria bacterium]|nr:ATP-dependent helicase [Deltaproteobacteria bacterium]
MPSLTHEQMQAVNYLDHNSAILAAAGSGKTFVIVEKVAFLVEKQKIPLEKLLVVTFTDKAGNELRERIGHRLKLSNAKLNQAFIGTLHSFAADRLRVDGTQLSLSPNFRVMEDFIASLDRLQAIRRSFLKIAAQAPETDATQEAVALLERYGLERSIRFLKDLKNPESFSDFPYPHLFDQIEREYQDSKMKRNLLDFDDLEAFFLKLLSDPVYQKKQQQHYQWIIVDEFQDINPAQWKILSLLHNPHSNRLVIVGDPRQSIYRFRGSDPSLFKKVSEKIKKEKGQLFELRENFRSANEILQVVNQISQALFTDLHFPFSPMVAHKTHTGCVERIFLTEGGGANESRREEAALVTDRLLALHQQGHAWRQMALLFRTKKAIQAYELQLKQKNIPYETSAGEPLLERPEILILLYALRRFLTNDASSLQFIEEVLKGTPLESFSFLLPIDPIDFFITSFFEQGGPHFTDPEVTRNIQAFQTLIENLMTYGIHDLKTLLETLQALRDQDAMVSCPPPKKGDLDVVRLMTVHGAKGLEFPVVFLCDLKARSASSNSLYMKDDDGGILLRDPEQETGGLKETLKKNDSFERREQKEKEEQIEESKRLLYVALTRATERLILPLPTEKKSKGNAESWAKWIML